MSYKSNYEPYNQLHPSPPEEFLNPLISLYPHVVALQLQSESYWADTYTAEDYSKPRRDDSTACRFVSQIRRFLGRDEMKRRLRGAAATATTAAAA